MPLWHIDYFELKVLEKQLMQGHSDLPISLKAGDKFPCERYPPGTGSKDTSLTPEIGNSGLRRLSKQTLLSFFTNWYASLSFSVLSGLYEFITSLSNKYKSCLLWSFL